MTSPVSTNSLSSNLVINGRQVYMPAMREVNAFLTGPLDSEMALSKQFNPAGSNGDFFKMMSSLMTNFKVQATQSANMLQAASLASAATPVATAAPIATAATGQTLSPSDISAISSQLGSIINSITTMLTSQASSAKVTNASADKSSSSTTSKTTAGNAGTAAKTQKQVSTDKAKA